MMCNQGANLPFTTTNAGCTYAYINCKAIKLSHVWGSAIEEMPAHFSSTEFSTRRAKRGSKPWATCKKQKWKLVRGETCVCHVEMGDFPLFAIEVAVGYKRDSAETLQSCVGILGCLVDNYKRWPFKRDRVFI